MVKMMVRVMAKTMVRVVIVKRMVKATACTRPGESENAQRQMKKRRKGKVEAMQTIMELVLCARARWVRRHKPQRRTKHGKNVSMLNDIFSFATDFT